MYSSSKQRVEVVHSQVTLHLRVSRKSMKASGLMLWKAHYLPICLLALYPVIMFLLTIPWCQRQSVAFVPAQ